MKDSFEIELKECLVNMMAWFHTFCVENNIRYYALGGTMLGVARHQGFIPWDDDIDIGIPRRDYERLRELFSDTNTGRYILETPHTDAKDYYYTYSKLYDTQTTLVEHTRYKITRGVFIDIFPLDGLGDSKEECQKRFKKIDFYFYLLIARITAIRKGRNPIKNISVLLARIFPQCLVNDKKILMKIDDLCKENDFEQCVYGGNLLGTWRYKEVMPTRIMGKPTLYPFETIEIYGAEHFEEYLTHLYGDWRKLPPKEKQITHHDFIMCDLHKAYRRMNKGENTQ